MNDNNLATIQTTFSCLMKKNVRVIFEDPGDKKAKVWTGMMVLDDGDFIQLETGEGLRSFVCKRFIVAIHETPR